MGVVGPVAHRHTQIMTDPRPSVRRSRVVSTLQRVRRHAPSAAHRRWIGVAVLAAFVLVVVLRLDLDRMEQTFLRADWLGAAAALALLLLSLVVRSIALKLIADAFGPARARLRDVLSATSIGLLANCLIPLRVGSLVTPYILFVLLRRRHAGIPFPTVLGMTVTERLFAIASFVALSLLFISTQSAPPWVMQVLAVAAAGTAILLAGGVLLERHRQRLEKAGGAGEGAPDGQPAWRPGEAASHGGRAARAAAMLHHAIPEIVDSQRIMGRPLRAILVAGVQTLALLLQLAAAYAAFEALHLEGAGLPAVALVIVLTNLIGLIPLTPGNLGTFQVAAVAALAMHGVAAAPAMAFAVGLQTMELAVAVVAGLISLSVQDLRLADLRAHGSRSAALLSVAERAAPSAD
jgi:uncharacterized protein (TIRG00374 family)